MDGNPILFNDVKGDYPPSEILQKYALQLSQAKFGKPLFNESNENEVKEVYYDQSNKMFAFYYFGKDRPSNVLDQYKNQVIKGELKIDCGMYVALVYALSYKEIVGNDEFDKKFYDSELKAFTFEFDQFGLLSPENKPSFDNDLTQEFSIENQLLAELDLRSIPVGSFAVLSANDPENAENDYQHENIIKVGDDMFSGFPLTNSNGSVFMTIDEVKQTVSNEGSIDGKKTDYHISQTTKKELPKK